MKPAWDQLAQEFADSTTVLVADVDCTDAGKSLCAEHGVNGFPTVKYGDPNDLQDYQQGRDYDNLSRFAKELQPPQQKSELDKAIQKMQKTTSWLIKPLQEDVEHILSLRKNAGVALVVAGFLMGMLTTCCICPRRASPSNEKIHKTE